MRFAAIENTVDRHFMNVAMSADDVPRGRRVPRGVKVAYAAFFVVWFPYYWHVYGPTNFLYFCDVAVFLTLAAVWTERPIFASMPAIGILLPQAFWIVDFVAEALGLRLAGTTAYMFDPALPLFARALSLFHVWLPALLVWLVHRLGYDRRALLAWTCLAWVLIAICYFWMPPPPAPTDDPSRPVNINYVFGFSSEQPQTWMSAELYVILLSLAMPFGVFLPTHLLLCRLARFRRPRATLPASVEA